MNAQCVSGQWSVVSGQWSVISPIIKGEFHLCKNFVEDKIPP